MQRLVRPASSIARLVPKRPFSCTWQGYKAAAPNNEAETPAAHPPSMAKEGTVIKGLNYHTNQSDPIAKRDDEYPAWLWTLLDEPTGDQLSERLQLKKENKTKIKQANFMKKKK